MVTGKANFREILQSLEESVVKSGIQSAFGQLAKGLGGGVLPGSSPNAPGGTAGTLPGGLGLGGIIGIIGKATGLAGATSLSGRPDGSQGSPFYCVISSSSAAALTGSGSSPFSFLQGGDSDSSGNSGGGGIGSLFGDVIGSIFGGGLAGGGDMTPGKAYLVGEKHPEILFAGRNGGRVVPSVSSSKGAGTINMGGVHIHGVQNPDSFQHSSSQIMAQLHRTIAIANARNS